MIKFDDTSRTPVSNAYESPQVIMAVGAERGVVVRVLNKKANPHILEYINECGTDIGTGFSDGIYRCRINLSSYSWWTDCGMEHDCELQFVDVEALDINPILLWMPVDPK